MVSDQTAGLDFLSHQRADALNFEQGQKGRSQVLSWVHQKAVPVGLAPHQGYRAVTSGVPLLQAS